VQDFWRTAKYIMPKARFLAHGKLHLCRVPKNTQKTLCRVFFGLRRESLVVGKVLESGSESA